jgi:hypothetical protein
MLQQTQEPTGSLSEEDVDNALGPLFQSKPLSKPTRLSEQDVDAQLGALYPEAPSALQSFAGGALGSLADAAGYSKILSQKLGRGLGMDDSAPFFTDLEAGLRGAAQQVYPQEQRGMGGVPEQLAGGFGSVLGMAPAMMTGPGGLSYQFAASGGTPTYYAIKDAGGSEEDATKGLLLGSAVAQIQHFGGAAKFLDSILGKLASPAILDPLKKLGMAEALFAAGKGAAKGMATQTVVGGIQQVLGDKIHEHFTGEDIDSWERFKESLPTNLTLGAVFGGLDAAVQRARTQRPQEGPGGEITTKVAPETAAAEPPRGEAEGQPSTGVEPASTRRPTARMTAEEAPLPGEEPSMGLEGAQAQQARDMAALTDEDVLEPTQEERRKGERRQQLAEGYAGEERRLPTERRTSPGEAPARIAEKVLGDEAIGEFAQEPTKLYAGPPLSSEDVQADIRKVGAFFKARKEVQETEPDILGNRKTLAFARKVIDYLEPHRRAKRARTGTGEGDVVADYVADEELRRGVTKTKLAEAEKEYVNPIKRLLRAEKIELGETDIESAKDLSDPGLNLYALARHAEEGNALIASRQPEVVEARKRFEAASKTNNQEDVAATQAEHDALLGGYAAGDVIGVGLSNVDAKRILDAVESGPKAKAYAELGERIDKLTQGIRDVWREYGLHEEDAIRGMEHVYKHFVSLRSDIENEGHLPIGQGLVTRGRETRKRTGRTTAPEHPVAFTVAQLETAIIRGEKNRVSRRWAENIRTNKGFWAGVAKVTEGRKIKAVIDDAVREVPDPSYASDPNVLPFKENGKQMYVEVTKDYAPLARAMNNADIPTLKGLDSVVRVIGGATRAFSKLRTIYAPEFLATNLARDLGTGLFTSREQGRKFARAWGKGIPGALRELTSWKLSGEYKTDSLKKYVESGAPVSYLDYKSIEETAKNIEADLRAAEPGAAKKVTRAWRGTLAIMEGAADVVENATRYSAFKAARAQGKGVKEAAIIAKNLTVNFERKGELGHLINSAYAFATAGIGGTTRAMRLLKHPAARRMLIGAAAGMAVWDQVARNSMGKDEDGEDVWDKIPAGLKSRYLVIPKYWTEDGQDYIRIPLPQQISWILYGGMEIGAALSGDRDPAEASLNVAQSALDQFNPLGSGSEKGLHKLAKTAAPTIADPIVDMLANKDFAGRPIKPDKKGPESYRAWPDVSPVAKAVAEKLNEMTGGDQYEPGTIDVSPEYLEFASDAIFGGLGQFLRKTYTLGQSAVGHEPVDERDVPILSRFQGKVSPWASNAPYKEALDHLEAEKKRSGKVPGKNRYRLKSHILDESRATEKKLSKLSDRLDALQAKGDRAGADAAAEEMDSLRQRFLQAYRASQE